MKSKLDLQSFTIIGPRSTLDRRIILNGFGSALLAAPLLGCASDDAANDNTVDAGAGGAGGAGATGSAEAPLPPTPPPGGRPGEPPP